MSRAEEAMDEPVLVNRVLQFYPVRERCRYFFFLERILDVFDIGGRADAVRAERLLRVPSGHAVAKAPLEFRLGEGQSFRDLREQHAQLVQQPRERILHILHFRPIPSPEPCQLGELLYIVGMALRQLEQS